jgi:hypothetical protein
MGNLVLCDRCNARALTKFTKSDPEMELAFCGHHSDKYLESLSSQGFVQVIATPSREFAKAI